MKFSKNIGKSPMLILSIPLHNYAYDRNDNDHWS